MRENDRINGIREEKKGMGWYNNVQAQRANASLAGEDERGGDGESSQADRGM